ncbi:MAG: tyrosine-type recombinase/integrase [Verrucomicrobiales bacterium]|nr:tyrosine-type recombinase/integrase [Verrucomicrobiales bacterium]
MKVRKIDRRKTDKRYKRVEWVLDYYSGGKRIRKWFSSKAEAETEMGSLKDQTRTGGKAWFDSTPEERSDIMHIMAEAKKDNISLRTVWEAFKSGKLDAAPMVRRTLKQAVTETIEAKQNQNLRDRYVAELENYLWKFASGREEMFIDRITVADIEQWFDKRGEALSTRRSNLGRLSAMFDVCWRRGYTKENICLKITPPKLDEVPPAILTPKQAAALLKNCKAQSPKMLPWLTLGMFAGIRPEEIEKLTWADVDIKQKHVEITAAASKTRDRRIVPLNDTALAWLKVCKAGKPADMVAPEKSSLRRHRRALKDAAGVEWVQDILRHTAASYLLQLHQDAAKVSHWNGHSVRTLETKYKNTVTPSDCEQFWALTPKAVKKATK